MPNLPATPSLTLEELERRLTPEERAELYALLDRDAQERRYDWSLNALPYQRLPEGDYNTVLWLCGRGAGKTRTLVENTRYMVQKGERTSIGVVCPTEGIYRDVFYADLLKCSPPDFKPIYRAQEKAILFPNGVRANLCSGERPDLVRGFNWSLLVCDEVAAWRYPETYALAKAATRAGDHPLTLVGTTAKSTPLLWKIKNDPNTVTIHASSFDNPHLPKSFLDDLRALYFGSSDWDNEVLGLLRERVAGALWSSEIISGNRVAEAPELKRVVVGVDPGAYSQGGDETGIVVAGLGVDGGFYVLADYSLQTTPDLSARAMLRAYDDHMAGKIVFEGNQGGDWIRSLIHTVNPSANVAKVHAYRGKELRAEPVSALYAQGKVHHVGELPSLEREMCEWVPGKGKSPNRLDALVFALTELSGRGRELRVY